MHSRSSQQNYLYNIMFRFGQGHYKYFCFVEYLIFQVHSAWSLIQSCPPCVFNKRKSTSLDRTATLTGNHKNSVVLTVYLKSVFSHWCADFNLCLKRACLVFYFFSLYYPPTAHATYIHSPYKCPING